MRQPDPQADPAGARSRQRRDAVMRHRPGPVTVLLEHAGELEMVLPVPWIGQAVVWI
jgi:hypothetical protein